LRNITADDFKTAVGLNKSWASTVTDTTVVSGICSLSKSGITHLSPHLIFSGSAYFVGCKDLKVAEGTFHDWANFEDSGIEEIGKVFKFPVTVSNNALVLPDTLPIRCNLAGTPLMEKDPVRAAEIMTGSKEIEVWVEAEKELAQIGVKTVRFESARETLETAIQRAKKEKAVSALKKHTPTLEI
jgi:hypothetical protein